MSVNLSATKRIVIKVGSSTLTGKAGANLDPAAIDQLVDVVGKLKNEGKEVIVVSSGAIAAGLAPLGLTERPSDLTSQQAAASVGQGLLMARYTQSFNRFKITTSQVYNLEVPIIIFFFTQIAAPSFSILKSPLYMNICSQNLLNINKFGQYRLEF